MDSTQNRIPSIGWWCLSILATVFYHRGYWEITLAEQLFIVLVLVFGPRGKQDVSEVPQSRGPFGNRPGTSREKPPLGYRGPFWNKPTVAYLEREARPFSLTQSRIAGLLLLAPFGLLFYLLWG